jgi:hypothetical protein
MSSFFIVAQLVNLIVFGIRPETAILVGGALIVAGGLTITLGERSTDVIVAA